MRISAKALGNRVKELRLSRKLTQEQLAEKANLHSSYIGIIERGVKNISVKTLNDILVALDVSLTEFFKPFDKIDSNLNEDEIYEQILLPLQTLPEDERNKILNIIKEIISLRLK